MLRNGHNSSLRVLLSGAAAEQLAATIGEEPTLSSLVRRRNELLTLLRTALVPDPALDRL